MTRITVKKGDITLEGVDAIVNPANSRGFMGGGVALSIKKAGGDVIEEEAVKSAPIPLGKAVMTASGSLKARHVIHSPTMRRPSERIGVGNVRDAVRAALTCALENNLSRIAFPGMGTGVGGVDKQNAARAMLEEIALFSSKNNSIEEILLVDIDNELCRLFSEWSKKLSLETG